MKKWKQFRSELGFEGNYIAINQEMFEQIQKDALESAAAKCGNSEQADAILLIHPKGKMNGKEYPFEKAIIEL